MEAHQAARCVVTDWRRINRLRLRCFRFRKCKNRLLLTVGGVFLPYAITVTTVFPWHNGLLALDVNDDGSIAANDAIMGFPVSTGMVRERCRSTGREVSSLRSTTPIGMAVTRQLMSY